MESDGGGRLVMGKNMTEVLEYDRSGYPVRTVDARLSSFMNRAADCHWHEDLEFTVILDGGMTYFVNGRDYRLDAGMGIFVNANRLHYGYAERGTPRDCHFHCLLFHPSLISGSAHIEREYVSRLLYGAECDALVLTPDTPAGNGVLPLLRRVYALARAQKPWYELRLQSAFFDLTRRLLGVLPADGPGGAAAEAASAGSLKAMIAFIHAHLAEKITLADVAAAGAVCRSKCCALFQKCLHQTVSEYVRRCRVRAACALLTDPAVNISEAAAACGFAGASFFAETFRQVMGMSPREYRAARGALLIGTQ